MEAEAPPAGAPPPTVAVEVTAQSDAAWVGMCSAIERKCFPKHEAMDVAKEVKGRGVTLLCAALGSEPDCCVGFAVLQRSSLALAVSKLVVVPAQRRQGVGRALLAAAVAAARHGRAQVCTLHVDERNDAARALYSAAGFGVTARREDYYRVGRSALVMELDLTS